jgi:starch synthase
LFGNFFKILRTILRLNPDLVHITGPHLWNPLLLHGLRREGIPTIHTLHDLHPHAGVVYGRLLYIWNGWVERIADHLLVHGKRYRQELIDRSIAPSRVTFTPLVFLFFTYAVQQQLFKSTPIVSYEPWALFFARIEKYKGVDVLIEAARLASKGKSGIDLVIAGKRRSAEVLSPISIPANVKVRDRYIKDNEALDLFSRCGLVVLPYIEASQSTMVAAAYFFRKPVVVTRTGALPEYVEDGKTGWIIPPQEPKILQGVLQKALADPVKLAAMGEAGRLWFDRQRQTGIETLQIMYNCVKL